MEQITKVNGFITVTIPSPQRIRSWSPFIQITDYIEHITEVYHSISVTVATEETLTIFLPETGVYTEGFRAAWTNCQLSNRSTQNT
ncbi:MAG: hypothetical protein AMJ91_04315, partial [candidate division Zixibacteria bacterium SM23_73_3]